MATNNYAQKADADIKSSANSTIHLNPHLSTVETPNERDRHRRSSKESTDRWNLKRASCGNAPQKMPPLRQVHK